MISLTDAHCDTIVRLYETGEELLSNSGNVDIKRLSAYDAPLQFFAVCLYREHIDRPFKNALKIIDFFYEQIYKYGDYISAAQSRNDILENKKNKKISAVLSLEGAEPLEDKLANLSVFYELGVRAVTLTWNEKNLVGSGARSGDYGGLTSFGKKVVAKMNELGMLIDVSHLNEAGFWDVYELSEKPFIASHSNAAKVRPHPRNLTDDQIKAVAKRGGVIGINLYKAFITENETATVEDALNHVDHILDMVGDDYIGIGCDFDGASEFVEGIRDVSDMIKFYNALNNKYGAKTAGKIFSKNFERVVCEVI
jgi:membrane dipeptidase